MGKVVVGIVFVLVIIFSVKVFWPRAPEDEPVEKFEHQPAREKAQERTETRVGKKSEKQVERHVSNLAPVHTESEFQSKYGRGWQFAKDDAGTVYRVTGGTYDNVGHTEDEISDFGESIAPVFGIDGSNIELNREFPPLKEAAVQNFQFQQKYQGFTVYGGSMTLSTNKQGQLININANIVPINSNAMLTTPFAKAGEVLKLAEQEIKKPLSKTSDNPVVFLENGAKPILAYVFQSDRGKPDLKAMEVVADAESGKVLKKTEVVITEERKP